MFTFYICKVKCKELFCKFNMKQLKLIKDYFFFKFYYIKVEYTIYFKVISYRFDDYKYKKNLIYYIQKLHYYIKIHENT